MWVVSEQLESCFGFPITDTIRFPYLPVKFSLNHGIPKSRILPTGLKTRKLRLSSFVFIQYRSWSQCIRQSKQFWNHLRYRLRHSHSSRPVGITTYPLLWDPPYSVIELYLPWSFRLFWSTKTFPSSQSVLEKLWSISNELTPTMVEQNNFDPSLPNTILIIRFFPRSIRWRPRIASIPYNLKRLRFKEKEFRKLNCILPINRLKSEHT